MGRSDAYYPSALNTRGHFRSTLDPLSKANDADSGIIHPALVESMVRPAYSGTCPCSVCATHSPLLASFGPLKNEIGGGQLQFVRRQMFISTLCCLLLDLADYTPRVVFRRGPNVFRRRFGRWNSGRSFTNPLGNSAILSNPKSGLLVRGHQVERCCHDLLL